MAVAFHFKQRRPSLLPRHQEDDVEDADCLRLESAACYRPQRGKKRRGEDALFINLEGREFVVADGVRSWVRQAIDAGVFARERMYLCDSTVEAFPRDSSSGCFFNGVLMKALAETTARGTSTACIRDSGVLVVRDGAVVFHSTPLQRGFNCQFSPFSPASSFRAEADARSAIMPVVFPVKRHQEDDVEDAECLRLESAAFYRPKRDKKRRGEDAHFADLEGRGFGVADGVRSWVWQGVDAGVFTRERMSLCDSTMEAFPRDSSSGCFLNGILMKALAETTTRGTSTACISDSGVLVVRDGAVVFHSTLLESGFNCQFSPFSPASSFRAEADARSAIMAVVFPVKRHQPADDLAGLVSSRQDLPSPKRPRTEDHPVESRDVVDPKWPRSALTGELPADPSSSWNANCGRTRVETSASYRPKKGQNRLGEDAHFINLGGRGFGVADGVGSWIRHGVDAGAFAREFMSLCNANMEISSRCSPSGCPLIDVLRRALADTTARGTSTACIGEVVGNSLRVANIGDSGFLLVRDGVVAFHSPPQQKRFNCPRQIGRASAGDSLEMTQSFAVDLVPGDVVVVGTDGLFDNLFDEEIAALVVSSQKENRHRRTAKKIARVLANAAVASGCDKTRKTPFAADCARSGIEHSGGKVDDVTVVVMKVRLFLFLIFVSGLCIVYCSPAGRVHGC